MQRILDAPVSPDSFGGHRDGSLLDAIAIGVSSTTALAVHYGVERPLALALHPIRRGACGRNSPSGQSAGPRGPRSAMEVGNLVQGSTVSHPLMVLENPRLFQANDTRVAIQ